MRYDDFGKEKICILAIVAAGIRGCLYEKAAGEDETRLEILKTLNVEDHSTLHYN